LWQAERLPALGADFDVAEVITITPNDAKRQAAEAFSVLVDPASERRLLSRSLLASLASPGIHARFFTD